MITPPLVQGDNLKRRGLLRLGTLASAITGAFALSGLNARDAAAAPPISEKDISASYVRKVAIRTLLVEDYYQTGDSDNQTWQRAVAAAIAGGGGVRLLGTKPVYEFTASVDLRNLVNSVIAGNGQHATTFKAASGTGILGSLFNVAKYFGGVATNITLEDFSVDGGMKAEVIGHTRDIGRTFGADYVETAIQFNGLRVPGESKSAMISRITLRRLSVTGCHGMPVLFRGCSSISVESSRFRRNYDPGFTFTDGVQLVNNTSEWSGDNGLSVSRGNKNVTVTGNTITGAYFAGIHAGGYDNNAGPVNVVIANNIIIDSGTAGISLVEGPQNVMVSGNVIKTVHRGLDSYALDDLGVGIRLRGLETVQGSQEYTLKARNITIVGNLIEEAHNSGIHLLGVDTVQINGNTIVNVGTALTVLGASIAAENTLRNLGIGSPGTTSPRHCTNVMVTNNQVIDNRPTPLTNRAVWGPACSPAPVNWLSFGNRGIGMRNIYTEDWGPDSAAEKFRVGTSSATNATYTLRGLGSSIRSFLFQSGTTSDWSLRESTTRSLEVFHYATNRTPLKFTNDTGDAIMDLPTTTGVSANVYLDSNGVLKKII